MAERIYPSAKTNPQPPSSAAAAASGGAGPAFPATKAQTYGRPMYRPHPSSKRRRRRGRSCCCSLCLWLTLILIAAVLLAAIAGGVFYVVYRPHRPSFNVSFLRLSQLNVTNSGTLNSRLDISVTARNPNKKIAFSYDDVSVAVSSDGVNLGTGSLAGFLHEAKNTSFLKTTVSATGESLDSSAATDLRKKTSLPLAIELETRAGVKIGKIKTKKIGIKVSCDGVSVSVPKKKKGSGAPTTPDVSCKVKLRIKIWKWTI